MNIAGIIACMLLLSSGVLAYLPIAVFFVGFFYGGIFSIEVSIVSERFDFTMFAVNLSLINLSPSIGSFLLSTVVTGYVYESHIKHGEMSCDGVDCFKTTFHTAIALCSLAAIVSGYLTYKERTDKQVSSELAEVSIGQ